MFSAHGFTGEVDDMRVSGSGDPARHRPRLVPSWFNTIDSRVLTGRNSRSSLVAVIQDLQQVVLLLGRDATDAPVVNNQDV